MKTSVRRVLVVSFLFILGQAALSAGVDGEAAKLRVERSEEGSSLRLGEDAPFHHTTAAVTINEGADPDVVVVTHNEELARGCDRVLRLEAGRLAPA